MCNEDMTHTVPGGQGNWPQPSQGNLPSPAKLYTLSAFRRRTHASQYLQELSGLSLSYTKSAYVPLYIDTQAGHPYPGH